MSNRDLRRIAVAILAILAMAGGMVGLTLWEQGKNRAEADQARAAYRYYSSVSPDCRILTDPADRTNCILQKEGSAYQEHYNQGDLRAQKDMATWTFGLFWVGVLGFVSGAIAIAFLYANLVGLDKQTKETRRIGEQQTRAYLAPVSAKIEWETVKQPQLRVVYKNGGQTPAVKVQEFVTFVNDPRPPAWDDLGLPRPMVSPGDSQEFEQFVDRLKLVESRIPEEPEVSTLWVYVLYEDVFGRTFRSGTRFIAPTILEGEATELVPFFDRNEALFEEAPDNYEAGQDATHGRLAPLLRRAKSQRWFRYHPGDDPPHRRR